MMEREPCDFFADYLEKRVMLKRLLRTLGRLALDERGGEVIEYVLIFGLIIVVLISTIAGLGAKVLARWQSVNSSM